MQHNRNHLLLKIICLVLAMMSVAGYAQIVALYQQRLFLYHIVYYTFASWMIIVIDATLKPSRLSR